MSTFNLANELRKVGHEIVYSAVLGMPNEYDVQEMIENQKFTFRPLFPSLTNSFSEVPNMSTSDQKKRLRRISKDKEYFISYFEQQFESYGQWLEEWSPDLIIIDSWVNWFNVLCIAKANKMGTRCVTIQSILPHVKEPKRPPITIDMTPPTTLLCHIALWWSWQRMWLVRSISSILPKLSGTFPIYDMLSYSRWLAKSLAQRNGLDPKQHFLETSFHFLGLKTTELVLNNKKLDFETTPNRGRYFLGPCIHFNRSDTSTFPWEQLHPNNPLIYCSLGTYSHRFDDNNRVIKTLLILAEMHPDWQFVLAGDKANTDEPIPDNVILKPWLPQCELLKKASVMIGHGGMNGIKEALYFGVPLILFPHLNTAFQSDTYGNAARIREHRLGLIGNKNSITPQRLEALLREALTNKKLRQNCTVMSQQMHKDETEIDAVAIVESLFKNHNSPNIFE
ncbi:MAG: nucleotide disphospho-sugar-binding domain-containing protein [Akkermansiaceae bacterium]